VRAYAAQITRGEVVPGIAVLEGFIEQLDEVRDVLLFSSLTSCTILTPLNCVLCAAVGIYFS
jgi:hypothetical protein